MELKVPPQTYYAHSEGQTVVAFSKDGRKLFTAGSDCLVRCFNAISESRSKEVQTIDYHSEPVTSLLTTKDGLITGSEDTTVVKTDIHAPHHLLHRYTRSTSAIRQLAVQPPQPGLRTSDKPFLAIACDKELVVKLTILGTNLSISLTGLRDPAVSIAFHPDGKSLMALTNQGALVLWDVANLDRTMDSNRSALLHSEDRLGRCSRPDREDTACFIAYHPLGKFVALPGSHPGDILLIGSQDLTVARTLSQGHRQPVGGCAWSPNGQFLATSSSDQQLGVWRVDDWSLCLSYKNESVLTHLAWSPTHNLLAAGNEDGSLVIFEDILSPSLGLTQADWAYIPYTTNDNELELGLHATPPTSQANVLALNTKDIPSTVLSPTPRSDHVTYSLADVAIPSPKLSCFPPLLPQLTFQPGSMSIPNSQDCLLNVSSIGALTMSSGERFTYQVKFRDPALSSYSFQSDIHYTLGSLGQKGIVLAKPSQPESIEHSLFENELAHHAQIFYRPHGSCESKDTWQVRLEEAEDIQTIAATALGPLVTTSLGYVRQFSLGGVQLGVTMAPSPSLIATACNDYTVFHAFHICRETGRLRLGYWLSNLRTKTIFGQGTIVLSPNATLSWIGISEEGLPVLSDSRGLVQLLPSLSNKATWHPICQLDPEVHLPYSVKRDGVSCLLLESNWLMTLNEIDLEWNLKPAHTLFDQPEIESQYMMSRLVKDLKQSTYIAKKITPAARLQSHMIEDKLLLRLLYKACQSDHPKQAIETAQLLNCPESLDYAEQIALRTQHLEVVRQIHDLRKIISATK